MNNFKPTIDIKPTTNPLGFVFGLECFGPKVENRRIEDIRMSLMNPLCEGPDIVYSIAMDVGKKKHSKLLKDLHLLYGIVTYAQGTLGKEPIRSQGHIHKKSMYGQNWSTPEIYQIWSGKAVIYMQEYADDNPGRCFAVYANPGDVVIVPPGWAHATISADAKIPLTFGAWCDLDYGFEYNKVRAHKGLSWYPLVKENGGLEWHSNPNYNKTKLIEKEPDKYDKLGIKYKKCIYEQFEDNNELFSFVPKPYLNAKIWNNFIP